MQEDYPLRLASELFRVWTRVGLTATLYKSGAVSAVVVIEDDAQIRSLLIESLTAVGYQVTGLEGGALGAEVAPATAPETDLLIVDVFMPFGRAIERLRWVREAYPGVPIVAISAQFRPGVGSDGATAEALRVDGVMAKPFEQGTLLDTVRSLIGRPR